MSERILNDRYALETKVGEGGMAITYRACDLLLNRTVAVKMMREQFTSDPQFVERFRREAQAAAKLSHDNVAGVYDTGRANGSYYIVMEFVEGTDLKQRLRRDGALPVLTALEIGRQIAAALEAAHSTGMVHRDIKPHNVLLNKEGKVKVTDFGIAKVASDGDDTGVIIGSVHYLSPEQARGESTTAGSDIYSLGAVLFEMLTGHTVFEGENNLAVAHKQVYDAPPRLRNLRPDIPAPVEAMVLRCLEKDPKARYQSAAEVKAVLAQLAGQLSQEATVVIPAPSHTAPADATVVYHHPVQGPAPSTPPVRKPTTPEPVEPPRGNGGWVITLLFLVLAAGVAYGVFSLLNPKPIGIGDRNPTPLTVPDLIGSSEDTVKKRLDALKLIGQSDHEYSPTIEAGKVCRQDPAPGRPIDAQTPIFYWISDGPQSFVMPDVTSMSLNAAKREIRLAGFDQNKPLAVTSENSDTVTKGLVVRTDPAAGANVDRKTGKVTVVLSKGPSAPVTPAEETVEFDPGSAPLVEGSDTVFVQIEFECPAGSEPRLLFKDTVKTGDPLPVQHIQRDPKDTIIVRTYTAKDENSKLEQQGEERIPPNAE